MPRGGMLKPITVMHCNASPDCEGVGQNMSVSVRAALAAIRGYQVLIRPLLHGSCRYLPTCSDYAAQSITKYGAFRGTWMGLKRLLRCHPFGGAGLDPVP